MISLACRSSRFSRSSCLMRSLSLCCSTMLGFWLSRYLRCHERKVSGVQPNLGAIACIAAQSDGQYFCDSTNNSTAQVLTSVVYGFLLMSVFSQMFESPTISGQFKHSCTNSLAVKLWMNIIN